MPQYHVGHLDRVARIDDLARATAGLFLVGGAYRGVGIPDCIRGGEEAADSLMASPSFRACTEPTTSSRLVVVSNRS
jgi:oxygen-dependent protoporphyrinogen oxidase